MFYTLLVLVLFSSFEDSFERKVQDTNRIRTLISLINKYTEDHGEALKVLSLNEMRKEIPTGYIAYGYNKSVDDNLVPQMVSSFFNVNEFLTGVILGVNHNGTTPWTTTTTNVPWRRKWKGVNIPRNVHRGRGSISKSVEDSKSNERWIPSGRKYYDYEEFEPLRTTKDPFKDATPFKLNYEETHLKNKNTNLKNNERDINNGKNWASEKDGKGRGSSENMQKDKSDDWNKANRKEKDKWDKPFKSVNGWDEKQESLKRGPNKYSSGLERKTKDSGAKEFTSQFLSKNIKDSREYKMQKKTDYNDYGYEKKINKDTNGEFRMKAKDDWDRPLNNDDFGKSKDDNYKPMKISWYTKKDDTWNKKANDWTEPLQDSWEAKKDQNLKKKAENDWDKPLKDSWDTKKDGNRNKKAKDDWDKPLKDSWETRKEENLNKKTQDNWDKPLKDSWEIKKDENLNEKAKYDWDKPLKDSWDTKKEKKINKQSKDEWDTPRKIEWKRPPKPKFSNLMNERHYPTYEERPKQDKRNRAAGGHGRTPIPFIGKRGIYEDK